MSRSRKKLPKDPNQLAAEIVRRSTEDGEELGAVTLDDLQVIKTQSPISKYLAEIGRKGGKKGGKARAEKLTAKKRQEIARKAAKARWAKHKKSKP